MPAPPSSTQCTIPAGHYFACQNHTDARIRFVPVSMACRCQDACSGNETCNFMSSRTIPDLCNAAGFPAMEHNDGYYSCTTQPTQSTTPAAPALPPK